MSRPTEERAIVDAGLKALAFDSGPPLVCDEPAATYERASDEHGRLGISGASILVYCENRDDASGPGMDTEKTNGEPTPPAITSFSPNRSRTLSLPN
jgi:hypothetical protein